MKMREAYEMVNDVHRLRADRDRYKADADRYRAALEHIRDYVDSDSDIAALDQSQSLVRLMVHTARAALQDETQPEETP